jgi:hypothetical protein
MIKGRLEKSYAGWKCGYCRSAAERYWFEYSDPKIGSSSGGWVCLNCFKYAWSYSDGSNGKIEGHMLRVLIQAYNAYQRAPWWNGISFEIDDEDGVEWDE